MVTGVANAAPSPDNHGLPLAVGDVKEWSAWMLLLDVQPLLAQLDGLSVEQLMLESPTSFEEAGATREDFILAMEGQLETIEGKWERHTILPLPPDKTPLEAGLKPFKE